MFLSLKLFARNISKMEAVNLANKTYNECIKALNGLISNSSMINFSQQKGSEIRLRHIPDTLKLLELTGLSISDVDKLNIIHVAGTKGKGSTSTYIDAILRNKGYSTGLFTSPHLTQVRERIRVNGEPITSEMFCSYFWPIYSQLEKNSSLDYPKPFYFQFLTIMAFHVFLKEKVDYVILEAGIGGRYDTTNIITSPRLACLTCIGHDHMEILGNTISEISWNKAGIIKPGVKVITCSSQLPEAMSPIIKEIENNASSQLYIVPVSSPPSSSNNSNLSLVSNGIDSNHGSQFLELNTDNRVLINGILRENLYLACAACKLLLGDSCQFIKSDIASNVYQFSDRDIIPLDSELNAIVSSPILGRFQYIKQQNDVHYFIDGAHTIESIRTAVKWFILANQLQHSNQSKNYLVFMMTGKRNISNILTELVRIRFDGLLLTPIIPTKSDTPLDFAPSKESLLKDEAKMSEIAILWRRELRYHRQENPKLNQESTEEIDLVKFFNSFSEIPTWLNDQQNQHQSPPCRTNVFVVGSLHLVGCALAVLS